MWCKTTIISLFILSSPNLLGAETESPPFPLRRTQSAFILDPIKDRDLYLYAMDLEKQQNEKDIATTELQEQDFITLKIEKGSDFAFFATELEKRAKQREEDGNDLTFEPIFDRYYKQPREASKLSTLPPTPPPTESSKEIYENQESNALDENGLPRERKKWSKHPSCAAVIFLVIGGLIGKFLLCS